MDLTSVKTIKDICARYGFVFKKGLGQNFLTDNTVLDETVLAAEIENGVLEIGPGFGVLTYALAKTGKKVVAVEVDDRLLPVLGETLAEFDNVEVVHQDILKTDITELLNDKFDGKKISIAANLPYYITTPIITRLLELRLPVNNMVFMVQKEVAERIAAKKSRDVGAISLYCQYFAEPEIICTVPAGSFYPPPKVDSAVLRLRMLDEPRVKVQDEELLFKVIRASFGQRRKTLANGLSGGLGLDKQAIMNIIVDCGFSETVRGETLSLEDFAKIADRISEVRRGV